MDKVEIHRFPGSGRTNTTILVVGGVHGNEIPGIEGVKRLISYLGQPELNLATEILARVAVTVVPIVNIVGYLAEARACPQRGAEVAYEGGTVIVPEDEKGYDGKDPAQWHDPNLGWEDNDTLVRHQMEWLMKAVDPDLIIFNHDWALPLPRLFVFGPTWLNNAVKGVVSIYSRCYPPHNPLGKPWPFLEMALGDPEGDVELAGQIWAMYQVPSLLAETYFVGGGSAAIHFAQDLYFLARLAGVPAADDEIANRALVAAGIDPTKRWWQREEFLTPAKN